MLKRKEKQSEHDVERLAKEKISLQSKLVRLKRELSPLMDVEAIIAKVAAAAALNVPAPSSYDELVVGAHHRRLDSGGLPSDMSVLDDNNSLGE